MIKPNIHMIRMSLNMPLTAQEFVNALASAYPINHKTKVEAISKEVKPPCNLEMLIYCVQDYDVYMRLVGYFDELKNTIFFSELEFVENNR